jgi:hypothetical protein
MLLFLFLLCLAYQISALDIFRALGLAKKVVKIGQGPDISMYFRSLDEEYTRRLIEDLATSFEFQEWWDPNLNTDISSISHIIRSNK